MITYHARVRSALLRLEEYGFRLLAVWALLIGSGKLVKSVDHVQRRSSQSFTYSRVRADILGDTSRLTNGIGQLVAIDAGGRGAFRK